MKNSFPYVIAEIASAHEGEVDHCINLAQMADRTGADAVKFQIYNRENLVSTQHEKYDAFGIIELTPNEWRKVLTTAAGLNADVVVEVYDDVSLALCEEVGAVDVYKVPSSDAGNSAFLKKVAATGKPILLATGGATKQEIEIAADALKENRNTGVWLMHGFQAYPTSITDTNLAEIHNLAANFGFRMGYADHSDADDTELAFVLPTMALAAGATVIEKHFTDARCKKGRDHYSALNPDEFVTFLSRLRRYGNAIGSVSGELNEAERLYRTQMKKFAVAARPIAAGEIIQQDSVTFKRTGQEGFGPDKLSSLVGRTVGVDLAPDDPVVEEVLS